MDDDNPVNGHAKIKQTKNVPPKMIQNVIGKRVRKENEDHPKVDESRLSNLLIIHPILNFCNRD